MATVAARKTKTSLRSERIFFLGMMAALVALDVWGFAYSFYFRTVLAPPVTYLDRPDWMRWAFMFHGLLFTSWIALFATQTVLIGSKRLPLHKQIGQAIYPLYAAMVAYACSSAGSARGTASTTCRSTALLSPRCRGSRSSPLPGWFGRDSMSERTRSGTSG